MSVLSAIKAGLRVRAECLAVDSSVVSPARGLIPSSTEPPRVLRRPGYVSPATMAGAS